MEFQNICNEMVAQFLLRHPVYTEKTYSVLLESVEELDNVCGSADIDE